MRKGVAVPYIIALILGIVVIGLLGYWFFVLGGQTGSSATQQGCNTKQASWCQTWAITQFTGACPPGICPTGDPTAGWQAFAPGCGTNYPGPDFCRAAFGGNLVGSSSSTSTSTSGSSGGNCLTKGTTCTQGSQCCSGTCTTGQCTG